MKKFIYKELVAASSRLMVLSILAAGDQYGYEIIRQVKQLSGGDLQWSPGMLYPLLHRLERDGLIEGYWELTDEEKTPQVLPTDRPGSAADVDRQGELAGRLRSPRDLLARRKCSGWMTRSGAGERVWKTGDGSRRANWMNSRIT